MPAGPVVLDDGHLADHARQRELFCVLCAIDVDVNKLIRNLWQRPDRALLIKERRAHVYEMQAKAGRPLFNVLINKAQRYEDRLKKKGCPVPQRVDDAVYALLNALEDSVNAITDRMEGDPPSSDDRTADRYASERRRLPGLSACTRALPPVPACRRFNNATCRGYTVLCIDAFWRPWRPTTARLSPTVAAASSGRGKARPLQRPVWTDSRRPLCAWSIPCGGRPRPPRRSGQPDRGPKASLDNAAIFALARATHSNSIPSFDV